MTQLVCNTGQGVTHITCYSFHSIVGSHTVPGEDDTMKVHKQRFDETWTTVLESITFS